MGLDVYTVQDAMKEVREMEIRPEFLTRIEAVLTKVTASAIEVTVAVYQKIGEAD